MMPPYVPLTNDYVFKKTIGENKNAFLGFVNAIFAAKNEPLVKDFTFLNTEHPKDNPTGKGIRLDVLALLENGTKVNIEVQMKPHGAFAKRSLYYWARLHSKQLEEGELYQEIKKTICINILGFNFLSQYAEKYHFTFLLKEQELNEILCQDIELHFLSIPKLPKIDYNEMDLLQKWLLLMSGPEEEVMEELAMREPTFREVIDSLKELAKNNPDEINAYEARRKFYLDYRSDMYDSREEGRNEGREEGRTEERFKTAKAMKIEKMPLELIAKFTELPLEVIEKI